MTEQKFHRIKAAITITKQFAQASNIPTSSIPK